MKYSGLRYSGEVIVADPGSDRPTAMIGTATCVHCGQMWQVIPGSGKVRGFCTRCNGPVCGPSCAECIPFERRLECEEKGLPITPSPTMVQSPGGIWLG